jgi:gamma-glutamylcysteine synthetase
LKQGFEQRLDAVATAGKDVLCGGLRGVEKESLRISPDGFLAQTPHPAGLGSALTNKYITTDFSEALLEFVTPAFSTTCVVSVIFTSSLIQTSVMKCCGRQVCLAVFQPIWKSR